MSLPLRLLVMLGLAFQACFACSSLCVPVYDCYYESVYDCYYESVYIDLYRR